MSLVNLAHICSHLQNASLARLGLTSIPYTRLHLSLSLLLQKQGFLSQVKLAGPSPPASCFPPGTRDNHHISSHPHSERGSLTPEHALKRVVEARGKVGEKVLTEEGFGKEAIEFAMAQKEKTLAQLERDGWAEVAADFLLEHEGQSKKELRNEGLSKEAIAIALNHAPLLAESRAEVDRWHSDRQTFETTEDIAAEKGMRKRQSFESHFNSKLRSHLLRPGTFSLETLQYFAGPTNRLVSSRELAHDGITISASGLDVPNQPFNPPAPPEFNDPWQLEEEGVVTQANRASRRLWLGLKYWDGLPVLRKARLVSKPTKRIWLGSRDLARIARGNQAGEVKPLTQIGEIMAVSTDLGVLEVRECVERRIGGMPLCRVW